MPEYILDRSENSSDQFFHTFLSPVYSRFIEDWSCGARKTFLSLVFPPVSQ
jgi:hypothetical protein